MPDPNKKISSPGLDACDRNVSCTGEKKAKNSSPSPNPGSAGNSKKEEKIEKITLEECLNPCATKGSAGAAKPGLAEAKETKVKTKECETNVKEKQAVLNKEPCPSSSSCKIARPEPPDAKARVDKTKPGCVDYESCEDLKGASAPEAKKGEKQVSGCPKFEDCKDLENDEKRKLEEYKKSQTQNKKK